MEKERNTKQKQAVYDALCMLNHPSATEVYERVHASYPSISPGAVFRVLGGFAESGKVRKLCLAGSDVRFDFTLTPHAHARCRTCGKVYDVSLPALNELTNGATAEGFEIDGCEVEFFGRCTVCTAQQSG